VLRPSGSPTVQRGLSFDLGLFFFGLDGDRDHDVRSGAVHVVGRLAVRDVAGGSAVVRGDEPLGAESPDS
jgi:hypothetical protein